MEVNRSDAILQNNSNTDSANAGNCVANLGLLANDIIVSNTNLVGAKSLARSVALCLCKSDLDTSSLAL